ncbi:hypothetical protein HDR58_03255 [bacterium]|nr:hypothetical protein [bacterium]
METKDVIIKKFEKRIEGLRESVTCNIFNIQEILNEVEKSLNMISYISHLKDDLTKKDGV